MKAVYAGVKKPLFANMVEHGKTPFLSGDELEAIGYKIVIYPVSTLYAATKAIEDMLETLKRDDTTANFERMVKFPEFNQIIGVQKHRDLEKTFL